MHAALRQTGTTRPERNRVPESEGEEADQPREGEGLLGLASERPGIRAVRDHRSLRSEVYSQLLIIAVN